jgi:hypothetical protein
MRGIGRVTRARAICATAASLPKAISIHKNIALNLASKAPIVEGIGVSDTCGEAATLFSRGGNSQFDQSGREPGLTRRDRRVGYGHEQALGGTAIH